MFQNIGYSAVFLGLAAAGQDFNNATLPARPAVTAGEIRRFTDAVDAPTVRPSTPHEETVSEPLLLAQASLPKVARANAPTRQPGGSPKSITASGQWSLTPEVRGAAAQFVVSNADILNRWSFDDDLTKRPTMAQKEQLVMGLRKALQIDIRPKISMKLGIKDSQLEIRLEEPLIKGARITTFSAVIPQDDALAAMQADPSKFDMAVQQEESKQVKTVSRTAAVEAPFLLSKDVGKIDRLPKPLHAFCKSRTLVAVGFMQEVGTDFSIPVFVSPKVSAEMLLDFGVKWTTDPEKGTVTPGLTLSTDRGFNRSLGFEREVKALLIDKVGDNLKFEQLYYFNSSKDGARVVSYSISPARVEVPGKELTLKQ